METVSLRVADIFNMSFDQVFIAGRLEGQDKFITSGQWKLFVNGEEAANLESIGERRVAGKDSTERVIAFKGQLDKSSFNLRTDDVQLVLQ